MSFTDDLNDDPIVFTRPSTMVVIRDFHGKVQHVIALSEVNMRRSEVDPKWLELEDAEQKEGADGS